MPRRSTRPLLNKLLGVAPLELAGARFAALEDALDAMGEDFSPEQLAAALDAQADIDVTVSTLYRWKREDANV